MTALRKRIKKWAFSNVRGTYFNVHTGWRIHVARNGISKSVSHGDAIQLAVFSVLGEIIGNAILVESHLDRYLRENVSAIHRFYAPMIFENCLFRVKLTVTESNGAYYYTHALTKIETPGRNSEYEAQPIVSQTHPGEVIVPDFLHGVKYEDGTPFVWSP